MSYQEYRPNSMLQMPVVVKNIIIINIILFAASNLTQLPLYEKLSLFYYKSEHFKVYQFVSYMFMHGGFQHIFFNLFGVYMFGSALEQAWGPKRFLNFYLLTGIAAGLAQQYSFNLDVKKIVEGTGHDLSLIPETDLIGLYNQLRCVGASGSLFGVMGAFALLYPNTYLYIYLLIPMKAKYFVILYGLAEIVLGFANVSGDNVAHFAHLGGLFVGLRITMIWKKR